jgi:hypothetical protein
MPSPSRAAASPRTLCDNISTSLPRQERDEIRHALKHHWPTMAERDRMLEGLIGHIREGIILLDQYDADHAGHG